MKTLTEIEYKLPSHWASYLINGDASGLLEECPINSGQSEQETIEIMRRQLKPSSFRMWRKRVQGRKTKHKKLRDTGFDRFKSSRQKQITHNKISKR